MGTPIIKHGKPLPRHILDRDIRWRLDTAGKLKEKIAGAKVIGRLTECPVCDSPDRRHMVTAFGFGFDECLGCRHLYCTAVFSPETFEEIYSHYVFADPDPDSFAPRVENVSAPKVAFVKSVIGKASGKWVDVGCGFGDLLYAARAEGWDILGLDSSSRAVEVCSKMGIPVERTFIECESVPKHFENASVVSLINVMEHLPDPLPVFSNLVAALPTGAHVAIEVPRSPSMTVYSIMSHPQLAARHLTPPYHLRLYSDASMRLTLERCGLKLAGAWFFGQDYYELLSTMAHHGSLNVGVWPEIIDSANDVQLAMDCGGLSDTMLVVAVKG
jgi:2-polyprenyl-3-methyl-5-hydroxy-6-metoxy-1,4-benzoquinol methylase